MSTLPYRLVAIFDADALGFWHWESPAYSNASTLIPVHFFDDASQSRRCSCMLFDQCSLPAARLALQFLAFAH